MEATLLRGRAAAVIGWATGIRGLLGRADVQSNSLDFDRKQTVEGNFCTDPIEMDNCVDCGCRCPLPSRHGPIQDTSDKRVSRIAMWDLNGHLFEIQYGGLMTRIMNVFSECHTKSSRPISQGLW